MKKHVLFLFATLLSLVASAHDFVSGSIYYNITSYSDLTVEVTYRGDSYDAYSNEYLGMMTIPSTVSYEGDTYSVTSIGEAAFRDCSGLVTINITEGVTSIGYDAFDGCSNLIAINIPESVTRIRDSAFDGCSSLTAINIPESVTSIGEWVFRGCSSLSAINIPKGVTSIGSSAFEGCSSLTSINIPEGVTSIGEWAFRDCSSLTAITIPEGVTSIGSRAFEGCSSLTAITIPASVTSIGSSAFEDCSSLTSIVVAEGNKFYDSRNDCNALIETSSNTLIRGCSATIIPESVTSIGDYAFNVCSSLTAITIPEGVTSIGVRVFEDCQNLTSITIPENSQLTSIGRYAFYRCYKLTAINIPKGVTSIESATFADCFKLDHITIPENSQLTSIGDNAFSYCCLESINIPRGVTSIGNYAFYSCALHNIYCYAKSVPATGENAFDIRFSTTLHVPQSAMASYQSTDPWSSFSIYNLPIMPGDQVTSLSDLSNDKVYTLRSKRAFLLYCEAEGVADKLCTSTGNSVGTVEYALGIPALHFRIEKQGDNYYLYSVGAGQYVDADGYYEAQANTVLTIENVGGDYPWKLCLGDHGMNSQEPGRTDEGIQVNWWTTTDVGNCYQIIEAATPVITLNKYVATLTETNTMTLTATVEPDDIAHETVTWSSSNPSVATVDAMGVVTADTPGTATITASLYGVTASCELTVERLILGTCEAPTIDYVDGQVQLDCATPDVQYVANMK